MKILHSFIRTSPGLYGSIGFDHSCSSKVISDPMYSKAPKAGWNFQRHVLGTHTKPRFLANGDIRFINLDEALYQGYLYRLVIFTFGPRKKDRVDRPDLSF